LNAQLRFQRVDECRAVDRGLVCRNHRAPGQAHCPKKHTNDASPH
jgi:hypothetical protein